MTTANTQQTSSEVQTAQAPAGKKGSMFKKILVGLAAVVVAFAVIVAMQSPDFRVSRSAMFAASPEVVFEQVNDFHNWEAWSPWAKLDPAAKNSFEGPSSGTGATFRWNGNSNVGEGSMTITESRPNEEIRIKLDFIRPFAGTNDVVFSFQPAGEQTSVTWNMSGQKNFITKAMGLLMDCEKMCGGQFEEGLANIKSIVEKPAE